MQLTFWGAAQTVTGSMHEISVNGRRILLDCGLYQGRRKEAEERNRNFPWPASSVDLVVLSHAHLDHSGNLPTLYQKGFRGPIYANDATIDLCRAMLADSAFLQERDAAFLNKRHMRRRSIDPAAVEGEVRPLYSVEDAEATMPLFRPTPLHEVTPLGDGVSFRSYDAGHMLGSTSVVLTDGGVRLGFSGDVGRPGLPIIRDPETPGAVDYLIMESTYGDRLHKPLDAAAGKLADVVKRTAARGGKIIAPAFAVGRTQQLVLMLHELARDGRIPSLPVFVDSPLAVNVTDVFRRHTEWFDEGAKRFLDDGGDPFGFGRLRYIREVNESKALNDLHGPFIVISASGMCEGGRILHHLRNNIGDSRNTILITGFQGEHTLGRKIVEKQEEVPIFGDLMRLRAEVVKINELSGHADQRELIEWMKPLVPGLKKVFLVHGEPLQSAALAKAIHERFGLDAVVPARGESFILE